MQPKLCAKCKKNIAVVFITKMENGATLNEGYCLKCARSLGIPQIDQAVRQMGISEEDLDTITYVAPNIELNDILLESIYLELDDECLCSPDCKGVCLNCGKNLNEGPCSCP